MLGAGIALSLAGLVRLAMPFVSPEAQWRWRLDASTALEKAEVNGQIAEMDEHGMTVHRLPERPVSVITRPLSLTEEHGRIVEVRASLPEAAGRERTRVVLLWQTEPGEGFKFDVVEAELGPEPAAVRFALPVPAREVHRLGVQFPDVSQALRVEQLSMPSLGIAERLSLAAEQVADREAVDLATINAVRGPHVLGTSLVVIVVALCALSSGLCLAVAGARGAAFPRRCVAAVLIAGFVAVDVQATWNLARQARDEAQTFRQIDRRGRMAAAYGGDLLAVVDALRANARGDGASFAVVSDDGFGPAHRLAYLVAPRLVRVDELSAATLIVVFHSSTARYRDGRFSVGDGPTYAVSSPIEISPGVYVLRRRWDGASSRLDRPGGVPIAVANGRPRA